MENIRVICLNVAANRFPGVIPFLEKYKESTEIFCFQEVVSCFNNPNYPETLHRTVPFHDDGSIVNEPLIAHTLLQRTEESPTQFMTWHSPHADFLETYAPDGNMMAVKYFSDWVSPTFNFDFGSQDIFALEEKGKNVVVQWIYIEGYKKVVVANVHGIWERSLKTDTEKKIEQSRRIVKCLTYLKTRFNCEIVLTGDLNLLPDTESIKIIEDFGLRNLIKEYGIKSTRTTHYKKSLPYADYVFVSSGIQVETFQVLPDVVSDHAPLQLTFSVL